MLGRLDLSEQPWCAIDVSIPLLWACRAARGRVIGFGGGSESESVQVTLGVCELHSPTSIPRNDSPRGRPLEVASQTRNKHGRESFEQTNCLVDCVRVGRGKKHPSFKMVWSADARRLEKPQSKCSPTSSRAESQIPERVMTANNAIST